MSPASRRYLTCRRGWAAARCLPHQEPRAAAEHRQPRTGAVQGPKAADIAAIRIVDPSYSYPSIGRMTAGSVPSVRASRGISQVREFVIKVIVLRSARSSHRRRDRGAQPRRERRQVYSTPPTAASRQLTAARILQREFSTRQRPGRPLPRRSLEASWLYIVSVRSRRRRQAATGAARLQVEKLKPCSCAIPTAAPALDAGDHAMAARRRQARREVDLLAPTPPPLLSML